MAFVTPERVKSLSVERMVASPVKGPSTDNPRAAREQIRARLRNVIHKVRRSLDVAERRYKQRYDVKVRPVNRDLNAGDWVFLDGNAKPKQKLGTRAVGPHKVLARGVGTFKLDVGEYPETVSSDRLTAAPDPDGDIQELIKSRGPPQNIVAPEAHQNTGREYVWEAMVATRCRRTARCCCRRGGGATRPRRIRWSLRTASIVVRWTSTFSAWDCTRRRPTRPRTPSPRGAPAAGRRGLRGDYPGRRGNTGDFGTWRSPCVPAFKASVSWRGLPSLGGVGHMAIEAVVWLPRSPFGPLPARARPTRRGGGCVAPRGQNGADRIGWPTCGSLPYGLGAPGWRRRIRRSVTRREGPWRLIKQRPTLGGFVYWLLWGG